MKSQFEGKDFYEVLAIPKTSTQKEIKKAYKKLALKVHPDLNRINTDQATADFQYLRLIIDVLTHPKKRKLYDTNGYIDTSTKASEESFDEAYQKWRAVFKKVTKQDIDEFEKKYKGSDMEKEDLQNSFILCKGDMQGVMMSVPLSTMEDIPRFCKIVEQGFLDGSLPKNMQKKFNNSKGKVNMEISAEEEREAEEAARELGLNVGSKDSNDATGETALMELFRSKKNARKEASASFLSMLEDKFCKPAPSRKRKKRDTNSKVKVKRKRNKAS